MRTELQLFEMYKEDNAIVMGPLKERSGFEEPWMTFKEWKEDYKETYPHAMVKVTKKSKKKAEKEFASMAAIAEAELGDTDFDPETTKSDRKAADGEMVSVLVKRTKPAPARAVRTIKTRSKKRSPKAGSKASEARAVFAKLYPQVDRGELARKDVITAFVNVIGLTKNGASTYYQRYKREYAEDNR